MSRAACKAAICGAATVLTVAAETVGKEGFAPPRQTWEADVLALVDGAQDGMRALLAEITEPTVVANPDLDS